jgi:hypothetical protein
MMPFHQMAGCESSRLANIFEIAGTFDSLYETEKQSLNFPASQLA